MVHILLMSNENKFNTHQEDGIKYQLFKAMIRKVSLNYKETNLEPEFVRSQKINKPFQLLIQNIL